MWRKVGQEVGRFFVANPTLLLTLVYALSTGVGILSSWALYREFGVNIFDYAEIGDFLLAAFKSPNAFLNLMISLGIVALMCAFSVLFAWLARLRERAWVARFRPGGQLFWVTVAFFIIVMGANGFFLVQEQYLGSSLDTLVSLPIGTGLLILYILIPPLDEETRSLLGWFILVTPVVGVVLAVFVWVASTIALSQAEALTIKNGEKPLVVVQYRAYSSSAGQVTKPGLVLIGGTQRFYFFYDVDNKHTLVLPQAQVVSIKVPRNS